MNVGTHLARGAEAQTLWLSEVVEASQKVVAAINRHAHLNMLELSESLLVPPLSMRTGLSHLPQDTLDALYDHHLEELRQRSPTVLDHERLSTPTRAERVAATLMLGGLGIPHVDREYEDMLVIAEEIRKKAMPLTFGPGGFASYTVRTCIALREPSDRRMRFEKSTEWVTIKIGNTMGKSPMTLTMLDPLEYVARRIEVWQQRMAHASDSAWEDLGVYALPPHMILDPIGQVRSVQATYISELRSVVFGSPVDNEGRPRPTDPAIIATTPEAIEAARFIMRCFCTGVPDLLLAANDFDAMLDGVIRYITDPAAARSMTTGEAVSLLNRLALRLRPLPA